MIRDFILHVIEWKAKNGIFILRFSLGIIFIWFGFLKYFPNLSTAETIASDTISAISFDFIKPGFSMPFLATWECVIGLGILSGKKMHYILMLLYLQMAGTLIPLFIFPDLTWTSTPFVPTLLGQYIIKNFVLISAGIIPGAICHGGTLISDPEVALRAVNMENLYIRYRRRFKNNPKRNKNI